MTYSDGRRFEIPEGDRRLASVFWDGEWEPPLSDVFRRLLEPGDTAVDVGANRGWFSLLFASLVREQGQVLAVEPLPPTLAALRENLDRNPDLRVTVVPAALGAEEGETEIHLFENLPAGHASAATFGRTDYVSFRVRERTLDDVVATEASGRPPSVVKIDAEGGELEILKGASGLLNDSDPPIWTIEVNYDTARAFGFEPHALIARLQAANPHRIFRINANGVIPDDQPEAAPHGSIWLCVPPNHRDRLERLPAGGRP